MKSQKRNNKEDSFELELFNALKSYGYLFPKNVNEVERFEELYGDTEISTPSCPDVKSVGADDEDAIDFTSFPSIAAYGSNESSQLNNFLEDSDDDSPKKDDE